MFVRMNFRARGGVHFITKTVHSNLYKAKSEYLFMDKCISCEKQDTNSVKFPCPGCGVQLMRCHKCRGLSIEYTCIKCGYKGP